jgi:hypothetical protein
LDEEGPEIRFVRKERSQICGYRKINNLGIYPVGYDKSSPAAWNLTHDKSPLELACNLPIVVCSLG